MKKLIIAMVMAGCTSVLAQTVNHHIVQRGETLESIATKYGMTVDDLTKANKDAQLYLYSGMKLVIPQKGNTDKVVVDNINENDASQGYNSDVKTSSSEKSHKKENESSFVWGFTYTAGTFDDVKASGHYGFLLESYDINGSGLGIGGIFFSFNFGLVDSDFTSDVVQLGPNYSFRLGRSCNSRIILPFYINYSYFGDKYKKLTGKSDAWGWSINPKISFGCLQAGLLFSGSFKGSSVSTGFSTALAF